MTDVLFARQSYKDDSLPVSAQRCVNCYAQANPPDAKSSVKVIGVPGIGGFATLGSGPIRGMIAMNGIAYAVSGGSFYEFDTNGSGTLRGTAGVITGGEVVSMDSNGLQIAINTGVKGWTYTASSTTLAEITDAQFNDTARTVTYLDGYFINDWSGTNKFFISALLDGTAYAALDFASAESSPDFVMAVARWGGVLLVFGEISTEVWDSTGALSFPFQPRKGSTISRGLASKTGFCREDSAVFIFGDDRIFYRLGPGLTRVSTHAIETAWRKYSNVTDAFCFSWGHDGHKFVVVQFPSAGATWVFDIATGLWHERTSWDATGAEVPWRINCALSVYGKTLVGDNNSGNIGVIDGDVYTEFGDQITLIGTAPPVHGAGKKVRIPWFELDMETGVGLESGQGSDPQVMFDYSSDGGRTWSNTQTRSMGAIGDYLARVRFDRNGTHYQWIPRVRITDPVKRVIIAARCPELSTGL